jgi:acetolactate synthase-1/2/3 large subunit
LNSATVPDFVMMAESMGCAAIRVESPEEVAPAIEKANAINDRPVVVEFRTEASEGVFPMVPAGASNDELILHPTQQDRKDHLK